MKNATENRMYLTEAEAAAKGLPPAAEQIERHNRRLATRTIVRGLKTANLDIALNQAAAMHPEVADEYRAELANRRAQ